MKIEELAADFAKVAQHIGVPRNDWALLKQCVESLAGNDARLPKERQKGYARIYRTYKPASWTKFFKLAEKHWPTLAEVPAHEAPPTPPVPPSNHIADLAWIIDFEKPVEPLVVASLLNATFADAAEGSRVLRLGTREATTSIELLVEHHCNIGRIESCLRRVAGVVGLQCRTPADFGSALLPTLGDNYLEQVA